MKKIYTTIIALFVLSITTTGQPFNFANDIGGTGWEQGYGVAADNSGNSYVTGVISLIVDFDPSAATFFLSSGGGADVYVAKYNATGGLVWAKSFGGAGDDYGHKVAVNSNGDVYVTGFFNGTVDFNPGAGVYNLTSAGAEDIFVLKLDNNGNFIWAIAMGGTDNDEGFAIALDNSGNCFVCGQFRATTDFDPGAGVQNLVDSGLGDAFMAEYDVNGNYVWAKQIGNTTADVASSIAIGPHDNIYLSGWYIGVVDLDPNAGVFNLTSAGAEDTYLAKFTNTGNLIWAIDIGSTALELSISVKTDNIGNAYITGIFDGVTDFDGSAAVHTLTSNGLHDGFIAKYDTIGNYIWAVGFGSSGDDQGYGVAVDDTGNVYGIGSFTDTVDFDSGAGVTNLASNGVHDICLTKYSPTGQLMWVKQVGGTGDDLGWDMDYKNNSLYYTGHFTDTVDFNPDAPVYNLTSNGDWDAFLLKMSVYCALSINTPPSNQNVISGSNVQFIVSASALIPVYQWQQDAGAGYTNLSNAGPYSGVYSDTLTVSNVTSAMDNYRFRCVVSDSGACTDTSNFAILRVCNSFVTAQPQDQTVYEGNNAMFSITYTAGTPLYQWQENGGFGFMNLSNAGAYSGVNTNALIITNVSLGMSNYLYRCLISDSTACPDTSTTVTLTVLSTIGMNENTLVNSFVIYPNPTTNSFTIKNISSNETSLLQIINPIGEIVYTKKLFGKNEYVVDAGFAKGIYFVKVSGGEKSVVRKLIVE